MSKIVSYDDPKSDRLLNSPHSINLESNAKVKRITEMITNLTISRLSNKSLLIMKCGETSEEKMYTDLRV